MKRFIFWMLFFVPFLLVANDEAALKTELQKKVDYITKLLNDKSLDTQKRNSMILESIEGLIDFELMSQLSLDKNDRQKLNDAQRKEFVTLFEKELKDSFLDKLKNYSDEKIELKDPKKIKEDRISLPSVIKSKNGDTEVVFKYYLTKQKEWKIYDLEVAGVSLVQSYRTQFSELLASGGAEKLLEKLRKK